ncbi:MAG: hypothetical protein JWR69_1444 [Pedosphaera sp.]|nr:hypothetical protein [Pedosphaera sp.]
MLAGILASVSVMSFRSSAAPFVLEAEQGVLTGNASTNLSLPRLNWPVLTNGTLNGGVFTFSDPQATNYPQRFYHVVSD